MFSNIIVLLNLLKKTAVVGIPVNLF
jgi:hypothetical protein